MRTFLKRIKYKVCSLFKNKELLLLLENFISLTVLKFVGAIVPFIAVPHLVKTLTLSQYGTIVFGLSIVTYFTNFGIYGFRVAGARDVSKNKFDIKIISCKLGSILSTQISILLLSTLLLTVLLVIVPPLRQHFWTYIFFIPFMWCEALFPSWCFQGMQKMKYVTIVTSIVKIFFTLSVFIFINKEADYWKYPMIVSVGSLIALVSSLLLLKRLGVNPIMTCNINTIKKELKDNFILFLDSVTPMLFVNTTSVVMGFVLPSASLGLYDVIKKITSIIAVFMQVVSETVFPFFNRNIEAFSKLKKYLYVVYFAIILTPLLFYKLLFVIFSIPNDLSNLCILVIQVVGMLGISLSNIYGTNYLIVSRNEKYVLKATIIASSIGFISAYPLVKLLGVMGGAINVSFNQLLLGGLIYYYYYRIKNKEKSENSLINCHK